MFACRDPAKEDVPAMSIDNIPVKFKNNSLIDKIIFTGAVGVFFLLLVQQALRSLQMKWKANSQQRA